MTQPVIAGFHPDPTVCRVADTYYAAHSSFEYHPGVPIYRSVDLVRWELLGNALERTSQLAPSAGLKQSGVYAPTLRHHGGSFWLVTTDITHPDQGHVIFRADDPAGPWSDAVPVAGTRGIDPDLVWDESGTCHLTWRSFDTDLDGIVSAPIDPVSGELLAPPCVIWTGTGLAHTEAPHLYRRDGYWYLVVAEGGTERGHVVSVARSRQIDGPYEECPHNPVLTHRSTAHPVQNTGHADLVERPDGTWAALVLGVRPRGVTPHFHTNGRETFLANVTWVDGWPRLELDDGGGATLDHSFLETFTSDDLHPRWVAPGLHPRTFVELDGPGARLGAGHAGSDQAMLLARVQDASWTGDVELEVGDGLARVVVRADRDHWYGVEVDSSSVRAVTTVGPHWSSCERVPVSPGRPVAIRVRVRPPRGDAEIYMPDIIEFLLVEEESSVKTLGSFDGRYLSTEVAGGFTGRLWGVGAVTGDVVVTRVSLRTDLDQPVAGMIS